MGIHKRREESSAAARQLLESASPVDLPPVEVDAEDASLEREEFRPYLPELLEALRAGGTVNPAPIVQSDSVFVIDGKTRSFWVRLWYSDQSRTRIARLHILSCLPRAPGFKINI
ncbi:MAG: hypothetical protein J2P41_11715 [Blastocatellia bacterium]|nr:hypothetical protein [Blastocatellia bacterium]